VVAAIVVLAVAHAFDYVTFLVMTGRHGLAAELNPIVVVLSEQFGLPGLTLAKLASVVLLAAIVVIIGAQRRRMASVILAIGITAGLVGGVSNIASL
jgi:hypothetical protein